MSGPLSADDLDDFARDGFVMLKGAFPRAVAARCVESMWADLPEERDDPSTWTRPVARLMGHQDPAFVEAVTSPRWVEAIHQVVGPGADPTPWMGGTCAIRFPIEDDPDDAGWHVDGSFPMDGTYGLNRRSRDRALLMLVLYTSVGPDDAPTRIRVGSHRLVTAVLEQFGEEGCRFDAVVPLLDSCDTLPIDVAVGDPGDVYLCHPFLVHAAQKNRGTTVRFMSQPPVPWKAGFDLLSR